MTQTLRRSLICVAAVALLGCGSPSGEGGTCSGGSSSASDSEAVGITGTRDGPTFESVEQLAAGADVAITGQVVASLGSLVDDGGEVDGGEILLCMFDVSVHDVLVGDVAGERITVAMIDVEAGAGMQNVQLAEGDELVLYLRRETSATAPGVDVEGDFYTPLNVGNGVLRIVDEQAMPTGALPNRLREDGPPLPPPTVADDGEEAPPEDGGPLPVDGVVEVSRAAARSN